MADVTFARAFRRHVDCPDATIDGATVRAVLEEYFAAYPMVRGYVLDDSGAVRKHIAVFHNDNLMTDRSTLADAVASGDRLHLFQALSGG